MNSFGDPGDIEFPQSLSVRIIMEEKQDFEVNIQLIQNYVRTSNLQGTYQGRKPTSGGRYASYAFEVLFPDHGSMQSFYQGLGSIPGVKTAI